MKDPSEFNLLTDKEKILYFQYLISSDKHPFYCNVKQSKILQGAIKKIEDERNRLRGSVDKLLLKDKIDQSEKLNQKNYLRNFNKK